MAKFFGEIGFVTQVQTEPGIWEDKIVEKQYYEGAVLEKYPFEFIQRLNDRAYIVPGLGDAGDRLYGIAKNDA